MYIRIYYIDIYSASPPAHPGSGAHQVSVDGRKSRWNLIPLVHIIYRGGGRRTQL